MLNKIKIMLGLTSTDKDDLLNLLMEQAEEEAINITHNNDIDELCNTIIQMVLYKYNRISTEGISSESYSGVSFNYTTDYPDAIVRSLKAKRKVQVI